MSLVTPDLLLFVHAMLARMGKGASLDSLCAAFAGRLFGAQVRHLADYLVTVGSARLAPSPRGGRYVSLEVVAPVAVPRVRWRSLRKPPTTDAPAVLALHQQVHKRACSRCGGYVNPKTNRCGPICSLVGRETSESIRPKGVVYG